MAIHDALSSSTLRWRAVRGVRPGYDLTDGSETYAVARAGEVEIGERLYRTASQKGGTVLVDVATDSRVASVRQMTHGATVLNVHAGRYRMSRRGVLPFALVVTQDYGGPEVLEILHVGPVVRVRAGDDLTTATPADVDLLVALSGMAVLDLLAPATAAAA